MSPPDDPFSRPSPFNPAATGGATDPLDTGTAIRTGAVVPPFRRDFDNARDPYTARNALGITVDVATIAARFNNVVIQKFTANSTYTPTAGMKFCIVEAIGGGGGGGGGASSAGTNGVMGGGGGSGAYSQRRLTAADIGASQSVTIGTAGTGGAGGGNNGVAGGDTSVGSLVVAKGGTGGKGTTASGCPGGAGGASSGGAGDIT